MNRRGVRWHYRVATAFVAVGLVAILRACGVGAPVASHPIHATPRLSQGILTGLWWDNPLQYTPAQLYQIAEQAGGVTNEAGLNGIEYELGGSGL